MSFVGVLPIKFDYTTFRWQPPNWMTVQEPPMGAEVHRFGKDHFIQQFTAPPDQSIAADLQATRGPGEKPSFMFRPFSEEHPPGTPSKPQPEKSCLGFNKKTANAGLGIWRYNR